MSFRVRLKDANEALCLSSLCKLFHILGSGSCKFYVTNYRIRIHRMCMPTHKMNISHLTYKITNTRPALFFHSERPLNAHGTLHSFMSNKINLFRKFGISPQFFGDIAMEKISNFEFYCTAIISCFPDISPDSRGNFLSNRPLILDS